ncbi:MAG: cation-transporting P-type ATPase [Bacteroidales bacterium]
MHKDGENIPKRRWHTMSVPDVMEQLQTDQEAGLDQEEVKVRQATYGRNDIPRGKKRSAWIRLITQFNNMLIYVLLAAAVVTALMHHWIDTWVILAVIIINSLIGFIQEGKAERALESIRAMLSLEAVVIRHGNKQTVDAGDLVPGDIVLLKSGDKVPADIRLVKSKDLRVEESPLTGESMAVEKQTDPVEADAIPGDQFSMVFSGTVVTYGKATGVVVGIGSDTEIGKINQMISDVEKMTTPLLQQIEKFGKGLSLFILGFSAVFFAFGYFFRDYPMADLFLAMIGLVVAAIPEGLPAIMTITLAIGVQRMASRNAIIRRLPSVETLGAVNVICTDKTGTLTRNEMTARAIFTADKEYHVEGTGYKPQGKIFSGSKEVDPAHDMVLMQLLRAVRICNNASIRADDNGNWVLTGVPTEGALLTLSYKAGLKDFNPERMDSIPFESDHKYMATLNKVDDELYVFMTGAPERVLEMSTEQYTADGAIKLDQSYWEKRMAETAGKGHRLLGVAFSKTDHDRTELEKDDLEKNKIFLGFIGIIDPPRDEVISAISECKDAGVKVKMITGDHVITARAIGKELGIGDGEKALTGKELEEMNDEQFREVVEEYDIYARTTPEHKLRLVTALQENGHLCAMTGDGVNDAPALKKANIGIAMGIKGTDVSKDAAEMVLADDNFASIVHAIEEGRTVYDNIRKALLFILPTNGAESLVLVAAVILGIVMPITPAQILWVNMVTAVTLALAIAFEPMEDRVMARSPRRPDEPILGKLFIWRIAFVSFLIGGLTLGIFAYAGYLELDKSEARTIAVNTLVAGQLFYLFNCRKINSPSLSNGFFRNKYVFIASGALILLQFIFVYLPFMNTFFDSSPIEGRYWLYSLAGGLVVFLIVELEKTLLHRRLRK